MRPRVAIFEDDQAHQAAFRRALGEDFDVLFFSNASAAREDDPWKDFRPDLVLIDCQLEPDGDYFAGIDVARYMNKRFPEVPLAVCSRFLGQSVGGKSIHSIYEQLPGVIRTLSKAPFPTRQDIFEILSTKRDRN